MAVSGAAPCRVLWSIPTANIITFIANGDPMMCLCVRARWEKRRAMKSYFKVYYTQQQRAILFLLSFSVVVDTHTWRNFYLNSNQFFGVNFRNPVSNRNIRDKLNCMGCMPSTIHTTVTLGYCYLYRSIRLGVTLCVCVLFPPILVCVSMPLLSSSLTRDILCGFVHPRASLYFQSNSTSWTFFWGLKKIIIIHY
jgi:hypothetical protein